MTKSSELGARLKTTSTIVLTALLFGSCGNRGNSTQDPTVHASDVPKAAASPPVDSGAPDIEDFESRIKLPEGTYPIHYYDRYYLIDRGGFTATYVKNSENQGAVYVVKSKQEIPFVLDGGCKVVNLSGTLSNPIDTSSFCNGVG